MANLKRTLALVLAVIMLVGMMAISAGAAFPDADKIQYPEAAAVMEAAGVIGGDENGNYLPEKILDRAEAATMITRLIGMGNASGKSTFTDIVGEYAWADSYVAVAEAEGIVAGNGDGTFSPEGTLTGYAWAKMLLCATGYDADQEGLKGAGWETNVYKLMK